ncbi:MAG TPA: HD-GYP domain-containing protein [Lapillicoccus sp.]|nr:HD-GYP domain-containing protein [Lapillicoccus sp.]
MTEREPAPAPVWPRGVRLYVFAVCLLAVVSLAASWKFVSHPEDADDWIAVATLVALGVLSGAVREPDVGSKVTFSFLSIVIIASIVLVGPVGAGLVGAVSMFVERGHHSLITRAFNAGMSAVYGVAGGVVYLAVNGESDLTTLSGAGDLLLYVGAPLIAADVALMLVNAVLLSGVVRLSEGVPPRRFIVSIVTSSGPAYIGYGIIGFLLVILWVPADVGPFSAVLILAPLFVARWAFVQFGEEQRAHERTLSALVTAVETKDPYAAGHSARIARLAEWMSEPLSMGAQEVQDLRFAAMLHDVGKVGVPTRILRRVRALSPDDLESLTHHPALGVALVREIEFLSGSLEGIRHHHERWDGLGYPDGLAAEEIPLISRVIAVADAFDALTTDRAERPALTPAQALKQIEQRRGRQFDPQVVAALATVLERHEWAVTTADEEELQRSGGYLDHDDPIAWERVWTTMPAVHASNGSVPVLEPPEPAEPAEPEAAPEPAEPTAASTRIPDGRSVEQVWAP